MPGFDGTGPRGQGPATGWGRGGCAGGGGFGGGSFGRGRGGRGRGMFAPTQPVTADKTVLEARIAMLERELQALKSHSE
ncbi:MAG: cytoplasmic protein [Deltaproteobacteria bacterium]|nr:cytoplasmic protein [Deltaproteobacteria bacterium]